MLFWGIAGLGVAASLLIVLAPLIRGAARPERRAAYDVQVYRDQLREIDRDVERGVIGAAEADSVRVEVSRKLLAAADAEAREAASGAAPRGASLAAAAVLGLAALGLTLSLYRAVGAPDLPDQPRALRLAADAERHANRPGQVDAEARLAERSPAAATQAEDAALVDQLEQVLEERPDDLEGHRLLARSLASLGRFEEARRAQARVVDLLGDEAGASDHVDHAEMMIAAAGGYVSPEAEAALSRALTLDPTEPRGRYYSGLTLVQGGRPDLAYRLWQGLLREGPPDAPWVRAVAVDIATVAEMAGMPPPEIGLLEARPTEIAPIGTGPIETGPSGAAGAAIRDLPPGEQQAAIEGMVASLGGRLAAEGGPPEDWAQLIRSLGVLGRADEAAAIWTEARQAFAGDPGALATVEAAARAARLVE